jgi:hypothetical protein
VSANPTPGILVGFADKARASSSIGRAADS